MKSKIKDPIHLLLQLVWTSSELFRPWPAVVVLLLHGLLVLYPGRAENASIKTGAAKGSISHCYCQVLAGHPLLCCIDP